MKYVIYKMSFQDGSFYIGSSSNYTRRREHHRRQARMCSGVNRKVREKVASGLKFEFNVVAQSFTREALHLVEGDVIATLRPDLNVNMQPQKIPEVAGIDLADGTSYAAYYYRKQHGLTEQQARGFETAPKKERNVKQRHITSGGVTLTLNRWATRIGVKPSTIHCRLNIGWTEDEAVGTTARPEKPKKPAVVRKEHQKYTVNGVTGGVTELSRLLGLNAAAVAARIKLGWTPEEAFEVVHRSRQNQDQFRRLAEALKS
jgi:hypothetical protein